MDVDFGVGAGIERGTERNLADVSRGMLPLLVPAKLLLALVLFEVAAVRVTGPAVALEGEAAEA